MWSALKSIHSRPCTHRRHRVSSLLSLLDANAVRPGASSRGAPRGGAQWCPVVLSGAQPSAQPSAQAAEAPESPAFSAISSSASRLRILSCQDVTLTPFSCSCTPSDHTLPSSRYARDAKHKKQDMFYQLYWHGSVGVTSTNEVSRTNIKRWIDDLCFAGLQCCVLPLFQSCVALHQLDLPVLALDELQPSRHESPKYPGDNQVETQDIFKSHLAFSAISWIALKPKMSSGTGQGLVHSMQQLSSAASSIPGPFSTVASLESVQFKSHAPLGKTEYFWAKHVQPQRNAFSTVGTCIHQCS